MLFLFFLIEAAQYECLYRRTAHHATAMINMPKQNFLNPEFGNVPDGSTLIFEETRISL